MMEFPKHIQHVEMDSSKYVFGGMKVDFVSSVS